MSRSMGAFPQVTSGSVCEASELLPETEIMMEPVIIDEVWIELGEYHDFEEDKLMMLLSNDLIDHPSQLLTEPCHLIDDDTSLEVLQRMGKYVKYYQRGNDAECCEFAESLFQFAKQKACANVMIENNILVILRNALSIPWWSISHIKILLKIVMMLQRYDNKFLSSDQGLIRQVSDAVEKVLPRGFLVDGGNDFSAEEPVLFALEAFVRSHTDMEVAIQRLLILITMLHDIGGFDDTISYAENVITNMKRRLQEKEERMARGEGSSCSG